MASEAVVPPLQQLSLQFPALPPRRGLRDFVESSCTDPGLPYPYVFAAASSWFGGTKVLIKGWSGIGTDTKSGALMVVDLMEIVGHWQAAQDKSIQLQFQHVGAALKKTDVLQRQLMIEALREAGCILLDQNWKLHCAAMYDTLFVRNSGPPCGNLELVVIAGRAWKNFEKAGLHPNPSKTVCLFEYHLLQWLVKHGKTPWEAFPLVGHSPKETEMMAHSSCLAMYIGNKKSPWRVEYAQMYARSKERYEVYRAEGTKKQSEILQELREWIDQDFGRNTVVMPSAEYLQK